MTREVRELLNACPEERHVMMLILAINRTDTEEGFLKLM